jgi:hypothetical protein
VSATINLHGPFDFTTRLIDSGEFAKDPFVTLAIVCPGSVSVSLIKISGTDLDALADAVSAASAKLTPAAVSA